VASTSPLEAPRRQRPGQVIKYGVGLNDLRQIKHLENLLREAQEQGLPREVRLKYRAEIRRRVESIREALPPIDAPPAPPRETKATNPDKVTKIRQARPRREDPIKGREQYLQDAKAVRQIVASIDWATLTGAKADLLAGGYHASRPAIRELIKRELVLLAAKMTEAEDQSARVVLAFVAVLRRGE